MKRILHEIKIDEISGVDRPAQEGAVVAIMKRHRPLDLLEGAIENIRTNLAAIKQDFAKLPKRKEAVVPTIIAKDYEEETRDAVNAQRRGKFADAMNKAASASALTAARRADPEGFAAYQAVGRNDGFAELVKHEIAASGGHMTEAVARARVMNKYGANTPADAVSALRKARDEGLAAEELLRKRYPRGILDGRGKPQRAVSR